MDNSVVFTSWPRMGQSFLRTYLEKITGIATGCEISLDFITDQQMFPFMGEETNDASVWVKKSHWPVFIPGNLVTIGNKYLICVRNPYDAIRSAFHYFSLFVQGGEFAEPISDFPEEWDKFVKAAAEDIAAFTAYVIEHIAPKVPTLFIRYEDLRFNP